jgi:hypothetical protein
VLAGEVAAVGEVPGDDVGPGERLHPMRLTSRRTRGPRRGSSRPLRAPSSSANLSIPVRAMGRTNSGKFASRASAPDVHGTGRGSAGRASPPAVAGIIAPNGHLVPDSPAFAAAPAGPASAAASAGPIRSQAMDDLRLVCVGEHRDLVATLGARVDDRERTALWRTDGLELHRAVAGGHTEISSQAVQELLRHVVERLANGRVGQLREIDPLIAVPCQLWIERYRPRGRGLPESTCPGTRRVA